MTIRFTEVTVIVREGEPVYKNFLWGLWSDSYATACTGLYSRLECNMDCSRPCVEVGCIQKGTTEWTRLLNVDHEADCTIHELECIMDWNGLWTEQNNWTES